MNEAEFTRRGFLAAGASAGAWAAAAWHLPSATAFEDDAPNERPRVVRVASDHVVRGRYVHRTILGEMLTSAVNAITREDDLTRAWRRLLKSDDVIGLKFNGSGADALATNEAFADALITSLLAAGFSVDQMVAVEAPDAVYARHGVARPVYGWQAKPVDFGSGRDQLAAVLDQVTALINVPFLKTHNIAGITCGMKNLSHAMVKHPARYHGNHCAPFIGDIVALPAIREKLRLTVVNALRVVFDKGPEPEMACTWDAGELVVGVDPVATDSIGLDIINSQRLIYALPRIETTQEARHLEAAAKRRLGVHRIHQIDTIRLRV